METRLRRTILFFVLVTAVGLVVILPYRLYSRDAEMVQQHVRVVSDELALVGHLVKVTMLNAKDDGNAEAVSDNLRMIDRQLDALYDGLEKNQGFRFRILRAPAVEAQYAAAADRGADSPQAQEVLATARPVSTVDGAVFTNWSPITADDQCGGCHVDAAKVPVVAGATLGVIETRFDLTRERARSNRTIIEITGFLIVMIGLFAVVTLVVVRKSLVAPIRALAAALERRATDPATPLPTFTTPEMQSLVAAIERRSQDDGEKPDAS